MGILVKRRTQGFTIVELLIVIVVIAILAAITIVAYNGVANRASDSSAKATIQTIVKKVEIEKINNQTYPSTLANLSGTTITANSDARVEYTSDGSTYCLTVSSIRAKVNYYQNNTSGAVASGKCTNHSGYVAGTGVVITSASSSIFGASPPTGSYSIFNDGSGSLWVGDRFYTTRTNGIQITGARVWEPASASAGFLSTSVSVQAFTEDWQGMTMGGWNTLGAPVTTATYSGTRTAGTWTSISFPTPITLPKANPAAGPKDFVVIAVKYDGTNYAAANPAMNGGYTESNQVSGVYLSEDTGTGRAVSNAYPTYSAGYYYAIDLLFSPL